jgi:hypothetical protein
MHIVVQNHFMLLLELAILNSCTLNDAKIVTIKIGWFRNGYSQAMQYISNWNCLLYGRAHSNKLGSICWIGNETLMLAWPQDWSTSNRIIIPVMKCLINWLWAWSASKSVKKIPIHYHMDWGSGCWSPFWLHHNPLKNLGEKMTGEVPHKQAENWNWEPITAWLGYFFR